MIETIEIGKRYRNLKTGTIYIVLGFGKHSETLEELVTYAAYNEREKKHSSQWWHRPVQLFKEKFEEV